MDSRTIGPSAALKGECAPPPDKSISHRAVMFSCLAGGTSTVRNYLEAGDVASTIGAFRALGIEISRERGILTINGRGLHGLREPGNVIDCGNSGTTMRLLAGILAGNPFFSVLTGDDSLRLRPMARVIVPLGLMSARIIGRGGDRFPPLAIRGGELKPIRYEMPIASGQVKSSLMLAALYAGGTTEIIEPLRSRDHTERMLPAFGADISVEGLRISVTGGRELRPVDIEVPGDFSSAAFLIVGALLVPGSEITIRNVGLNPTRTGLLDVLRTMGARIETAGVREVTGEPVGDIHCRSSADLTGVTIGGDEIPSLIDEFPILCVAASLARGTTRIRGAAELRFKESDRIGAMATELRKMGVEIEEYPDGVDIRGRDNLQGALLESHGDHRIAMSLSVAGLVATGETTIRGASAVGISFPGFFDVIGRLAQSGR